MIARILAIATTEIHIARRHRWVLIAVLLGDPAQEAAILAAARARLGTLKAPRALIWRQDWPVLASGKPDLVRLAGEAGL